MRTATHVPKRVLIVGGSSEIGGALARSWLARGTREFVLTERFSGRSKALVEELVAGGATVEPVELNALEESSISNALARAWGHGDIDVAVIAVGLLGNQADIERDPVLSRDVLTVNSTATIHIALEVANQLERQQHGTLVLLSSVAGQRGRRDNYVYGASKAAVDTFAEGLQQRFADTEIGVLLVRPGYVYSKMSEGVEPAPFAVTVEDSRDQILAAIERRKRVIWVPRILGTLFGLFKLLPRKVWGGIVSKAR